MVRVAVVLAILPGVRKPVAYALAGLTGMQPTTFLLLDLVGALGTMGLVVGLGFGVGQHAVDLVLLIDRYASAVPDSDRPGSRRSASQATATPQWTSATGLRRCASAWRGQGRGPPCRTRPSMLAFKPYTGVRVI
jgi:hypothetical protein